MEGRNLALFLLTQTRLAVLLSPCIFPIMLLNVRASSLNGAVLLISYDELALLKEKIMRDLQLHFPLLLDPTKETYGRWGMGRTNVFGAMLSPSLNVRYVKLMLQGEKFLGMAPDMFQLGGDFVVDPNGKIAFAHVMKNNGDRATVDALMAAMEQSLKMAHSKGKADVKAEF